MSNQKSPETPEIITEKPSIEKIKIRDLNVVKQDPPLEEVQEVKKETEKGKEALKKEVEKYSIDTQIKTFGTGYEIPGICSNCTLQELADNNELNTLTREDILELEQIEGFKDRIYKIYPELLKIKNSGGNIEQTVDGQETVNQKTSASSQRVENERTGNQVEKTWNNVPPVTSSERVVGGNENNENEQVEEVSPQVVETAIAEIQANPSKFEGRIITEGKYKGKYEVPLPDICLNNEALINNFRKLGIIVENKRAIMENSDIYEKIKKYLTILNFPNDLEKKDGKITEKSIKQIIDEYSFLDSEQSKWIENRDLLKINYIRTIVEDINNKGLKLIKKDGKYTIEGENFGGYKDIFNRKNINFYIDIALVSDEFNEKSVEIGEIPFLKKVLSKNGIEFDEKRIGDKGYIKKVRENINSKIEKLGKSADLDSIDKIQKLNLALDLLNEKNIEVGKENENIKNIFKKAGEYKEFVNEKVLIDAFGGDKGGLDHVKEFIIENKGNFLLVGLIMIFSGFKKSGIAVILGALTGKSLTELVKKIPALRDVQVSEKVIEENLIQYHLTEEKYQKSFEKMVKINDKKEETGKMTQEEIFAITEKITKDGINIKVGGVDTDIEEAAKNLKTKINAEEIKVGDKKIKLTEDDYKKYIKLLLNLKESDDKPYTLDLLTEGQDIINKDYERKTFKIGIANFNRDINNLLEEKWNNIENKDTKNIRKQREQIEKLQKLISSSDDLLDKNNTTTKEIFDIANALGISGDLGKIIEDYSELLKNKAKINYGINNYKEYLENLDNISEENKKAIREYLEKNEEKIIALGDLALLKLFYEKQLELAKPADNTNEIKEKLKKVELKLLEEKLEKAKDIDDIKKIKKEADNLTPLIGSSSSEVKEFQIKFDEKVKEITKEDFEKLAKSLEENNEKIEKNLENDDKFYEILKIINSLDKKLKKYEGFEKYFSDNLKTTKKEYDKLRGNFLNKEKEKINGLVMLSKNLGIIEKLEDLQKSVKEIKEFIEHKKEIEEVTNSSIDKVVENLKEELKKLNKELLNKKLNEEIIKDIMKKTGINKAISDYLNKYLNNHENDSLYKLFEEKDNDTLSVFLQKIQIEKGNLEMERKNTGEKDEKKIKEKQKVIDKIIKELGTEENPKILDILSEK